MDRLAPVSVRLHMNVPTLFRLAGLSALMGGVLREASSFIAFVPESLLHEALYFAIDLLFLFGLFGLYAATATRVGWFGLAGFLVAATGNALIIGPDMVFQGIDTYQSGASIFSIGLALLALPLLWSRSLSPIGPILWLLVPIVSLTGGALGFASESFFLAGLLFGLGFAAAGVSLIRSTLPAGA